LYTAFYDLVDKPFELTPDPRYVFLSEHHKEALAHLKYGVEERKGFIQLTGEVGTGKTTMLDVLISELDASTAVAKLSHTTVSELDLLLLIARAFGIEAESDSKAVILDRLRERLSSWAKEGRNAVVVVDEAQNLSLPVLEEIRLLSNLQVNGRLGLQIILAGQPELREKLERSELRQLRQRIGIRYHLTPLTRKETGDYVAHRMAVAGSAGQVFLSKALDVVFEYSQGVPRVINLVCDRALLSGYAENKRAINQELVRKAVAALDGAPVVLTADKERREEAEGARQSEPRGSVRARWAPPLAAALAVVAIVVSAVYYFELRESGHLTRGEEAVASQEEHLDLPPPVEPHPREDRVSLEQPGDESAAGEAVVEGDVPLARPEEQSAAGEAVVDDAASPDESRQGAAPDESEPSGSDARAWLTEEEPIEGADDRGPWADASLRYLVVAASSSEMESALRKVDELLGEGLDATVWTVDLGERGVWYRITLSEGFESLPEAARAVELLQSMGHSDAWVVRR